MRSVPSFIGDFKKRDKVKRRVNTVKQELPIEREANVRQLKKQILQRLKKEILSDGAESTTLDSEADAEVISANETFGEDKKELGKRILNTRDHNGGVKNFALLPHGRRKDFHIPSTGSPAELQTGEKEEPDTVQRRKKSTGERGQTALHAEKEDIGLYVPSFASQPPATAERRRKTDEIKQKAAERRRLIDHEKHCSSPDINIPVMDIPVAPRVGGQDSSTPRLGRRSGSDVTINIDYTDEGDWRDTRITDNSFHLAVSPRLPRASSFPSVYEAASTFGEEAHFKDFARKKQDKLEEDLRRVEDSLNQTFSGLKKYLKTN